jgi:hypothetical protein
MAVRTTVNALPVCGQIPSGHDVPIAANQHCTTGIAFETPLGRVPVDKSALNAIAACLLSFRTI